MGECMGTVHAHELHTGAVPVNMCATVFKCCCPFYFSFKTPVLLATC